MDEKGRQLFEKWRKCPVSWDLEKGGKPSWCTFRDDLTDDLGPDAPGRLERIAEHHLTGHYYPPDALTFWAPELDEGGKLHVGTRLLQRARLLPFSDWPVVYAMTEITHAELSEDRFTIGYVTTEFHKARGWWRADVWREDGRLRVRVQSLAIPDSWQFWLGMPVARWLQLRARRRGIEVMHDLA